MKPDLAHIEKLYSKHRDTDTGRRILELVAYCRELEEKLKERKTSTENDSLKKGLQKEKANKLTSVNYEIETIENTTLPGIEKQITETRERIAALNAELSRMAEAETELESMQAERNQITTEIAEWAYLRNACSKNGLQALEIDGAAPLITGYANNLLSQAFGPLFTVRLRTQDDEGREVLDIAVIMEDGSEVLLDNLSGGQKVWILMALRLAMTLLSKEKSGRNFETALFDELDGPLDPENSLNFIGMYRAFMQAGNFQMIPFISHKPACRSMADHILRFEPGKNPVWG